MPKNKIKLRWDIFEEIVSRKR